MNDQDTSAYWRKLLEIDKPLEPDLLKKYRSWHRYFRPFLYFIVDLWLKYYCPADVTGLANLPEPPYILAPNHASAMDYAVVARALGRSREDLYPVATRIFYDIWFTRFWIRVAANAVRIDTTDDFFPALRAAAQILKAGKSVYINPEGTRSKDGKLLPFRPGVGVLAVETGAPIVPAYIKDTWKALPTGSIWPKPKAVSVAFGRPIEMKRYIEKKRAEQAYDVYQEVTQELRARIISLSQ